MRCFREKGVGETLCETAFEVRFGDAPVKCLEAEGMRKGCREPALKASRESPRFRAVNLGGTAELLRPMFEG